MREISSKSRLRCPSTPKIEQSFCSPLSMRCRASPGQSIITFLHRPRPKEQPIARSLRRYRETVSNSSHNSFSHHVHV